MIEYEYTVSEVAIIMGKDEETIRRYLRNGKLKGSIRSKKEGYRISGAELLRLGFLNKSEEKHVEEISFDSYKESVLKLIQYHEDVIRHLKSQIADL